MTAFVGSTGALLGAVAHVAGQAHTISGVATFLDLVFVITCFVVGMGGPLAILLFIGSVPVRSPRDWRPMKETLSEIGNFLVGYIIFWTVIGVSIFLLVHIFDLICSTSIINWIVNWINRL